MNNLMYSSFPIHMLPEAFQDPLWEAVAQVQAPPEIIFSSMLVTAAVACQGMADVQRKEGLTGSISINCCVIGKSGIRKSAADGKVTVPLKCFDQQQRERHKNAYACYEADLASWKVREKAICVQIRKAEREGNEVTALIERHRKLYTEKPGKPRLRRVLFKDTTIAALKQGLNVDAASIGLFAPEAGKLISGQAFADITLWNEIWDGSTIQVDRATGESFVIENARGSMSIMLQPGIFEKFMKQKGEEARELGLWSRFFITYPPSWEGIRFLDGYTPEPIKLQKFHERVEVLMNSHAAAAESGNHQRQLLKFTPEAQAAWISIFNSIESQTSILGFLSAVTDYASKYADNLARMAAVFHYFQGKDGNIDLNTLTQANAICQWYLEEFKKIFSPPPINYGPPQVVTDAQELEAWLVLHFLKHGVYWITKTQLMRYAPSKLRHTHRLMPAMHILIQKGVLAPKPLTHLHGKKPLVSYDLNPTYFSNAARQRGASPD